MIWVAGAIVVIPLLIVVAYYLHRRWSEGALIRRRLKEFVER